MEMTSDHMFLMFLLNRALTLRRDDFPPLSFLAGTGASGRATSSSYSSSTLRFLVADSSSVSGLASIGLDFAFRCMAFSIFCTAARISMLQMHAALWMSCIRRFGVLGAASGTRCLFEDRRCCISSATGRKGLGTLHGRMHTPCFCENSCLLPNSSSSLF